MITNEDLVACYPRRLKRIKAYEIWQFPYVKEDVLYDEEDLVGIRFGTDRNTVFLLSKFQNRLVDVNYINRIISLVHDISEEFVVEKRLVSSEISVEEAMKIIKK